MFSTPNYFNWAFSAINNLLNTNAGLFVVMGQHLFLGLATIMLAWYGIKTALEAGDFLAGMHFSRFAGLVLMISFGFAMINYYNSPIPGIGTDFHHLVIDEAQSLSTTISNNMLDTMTNRISAFEGTVESPGLTLQISVYFDYWTIMLLLALAQAVAMIVVAFGIIATAVCVLVGPIFIPFFIVPQLEWLFWGWFRCFIQYAFYQVIAAAVVFIIGNALTAFMNLYNGRPIPVGQQTALIAPLFIVIVASVYALIKVPMLTSQIFSGSAGSSAAGMLSFANPMKF
jgi:TrbL/VirB6 plasmid conjugal transfer protein